MTEKLNIYITLILTRCKGKGYLNRISLLYWQQENLKLENNNWFSQQLQNSELN